MTEPAAASVEHPSPARGRVSIVALLADLAAGPTAWVIQLVVGYGVAGYACYRRGAPIAQLRPRGWNGETYGLLALNLVCLLAALIGLATAYAHWRRTKGEKGGGAEPALEVGEGRTRFLSICAIIGNLGFALAIVFDTTTILGVPTCWSLVS